MTYESDIAYWTGWVGRRMTHIREVCNAVDVFIAPSMYLLRRFRDEFGIPPGKTPLSGLWVSPQEA